MNTNTQYNEQRTAFFLSFKFELYNAYILDQELVIVAVQRSRRLRRLNDQIGSGLHLAGLFFMYKYASDFWWRYTFKMAAMTSARRSPLYMQQRSRLLASSPSAYDVTDSLHELQFLIHSVFVLVMLHNVSVLLVDHWPRTVNGGVKLPRRLVQDSILRFVWNLRSPEDNSGSSLEKYYLIWPLLSRIHYIVIYFCSRIYGGLYILHVSERIFSTIV